jgi:hypothetical protein
MGNSLMIVVGTQGGARCRGDKHHPWTRRSNSSPITCEERCRSLSCANCKASVVRRATRGPSALSHPGHQVWRSARATHASAPIRRLSTSSTPSSNRAVRTLRGAERNCCRSCKKVIRVGRYPGAQRSATSCAAMVRCPRNHPIDTSATPANQPG